MKEHRFSRLPIHAGDRRRIVGILNTYDLVHQPEDRSLSESIHPPLFFSERSPLSKTLITLQASRQAMAIVRTEQGDAVGMITVKDLVEEVIGKIQDP
jgi:CBS domain containing-hemolysin-like protein